MKNIWKVTTMMVLLLLVACLPSQEEIEPQNKNTNQPVTLPDNSRSDIPASENSAPHTTISKPKMNPVMQELLHKNKFATNYYYMFDGDNAQGYEVFRRGNRIKKVYTDTIELRNGVYYNKVYIDLDGQKAIGICDKPGVTCHSLWNNAFELSFEKEKIYPTPVDIINQVQYAESVGSEVIDNRQLTIIEYTNPEGNKERLSVDNYYGLPLRQVKYDPFGNIEEKHTFTNIVMGQLHEEDVILPPQYSMLG